MNRIYRLVWNAALSVWVAVAENSRGCGKGGSSRTRAGFVSVMVLAVCSLFAAQAYAADAANAAVVAGAGNVATTGNVTTITQTTQRLAIDWTSLSTRSNELIDFRQPNASAIALNRITGTSPSELLGSLTANGQVFILNPNGVLFGAGSQVNVGGLVASTLSMSNADFMAGNHVFGNSGGSGSVINQGSMTATHGGYLALLAPEVRNEGVMVASLGTALLAAGNKVTLNLENGSLLGYSIDQGAINALAENKHLIKADGGQVLLSARAMDSLTTATVNNTGIIEAKTLQNRAGRILLMGDMEYGTVNVGGTLDASAPMGDGGFVETSAAHVKIAAGTRVTTLAANGKNGEWLIDPVDFTVAATGGDMTGATLSANLGGGNVTIQSTNGATGVNGDVNINDTVSWSANTLTLNAQRNININTAMNGSGTGKLALLYGQGAVAAGNTALYNVNAPVNLAAGNNFSTKLGSDGTVVQYKVITALGAAGSTTGTDLQGISLDPYTNYVLGADIDASATRNWNGGAGFDPLKVFTGTFDGLKHVVKNIYINRPTEDQVGLFGYVASGTIQNIGLEGGSVRGDTDVGALMGYGCCAIVRRAYANVAVTGNNNVGGLIGQSVDDVISDVYSAGTVTGNDSVGGLIGMIDAFSTSTVTRAYAAGLVTGITNVGGLIGQDLTTASTTNSYWDMNRSDQASSAGGTGKTTAQMMQLSTYAGWNIGLAGTLGATWQIVEGSSYPQLRGLPASTPIPIPDNGTAGFEESPAYRSVMVYLGGLGRPAKEDKDAERAARLNEAAEEER